MQPRNHQNQDLRSDPRGSPRNLARLPVLLQDTTAQRQRHQDDHQDSHYHTANGTSPQRCSIRILATDVDGAAPTWKVRLCNSNRLKPKLPMTNLSWGPKGALSLMKSVVTQFWNIKLESASSYRRRRALLQLKELGSPKCDPNLGSSRLWDTDWAPGHILLQATASILLSDILEVGLVGLPDRNRSHLGTPMQKRRCLQPSKSALQPCRPWSTNIKASCPRHLRVEITLQKTNVSH